MVTDRTQIGPRGEGVAREVAVAQIDGEAQLIVGCRHPLLELPAHGAGGADERRVKLAQDPEPLFYRPSSGKCSEPCLGIVLRD